MKRLLVEGFQVRPKHALVALFIASVLITLGSILLRDIGQLAERTEYSMATYAEGTLTFETLEGNEVVIARDDRCKRRTPGPSGKCLLYFENGDNVVVTYDSASPSYTWIGPTPGGFRAVMLFWGGTTLWIFAALWLIFTCPWYRRLSEFYSSRRLATSDEND